MPIYYRPVSLCPREELNPYQFLRRKLLYPLSYGDIDGGELPFDSTTKTPLFQLLWRTSPKRVDKTCWVPIIGFVLKKVGPYWIFLRKK